MSRGPVWGSSRCAARVEAHVAEDEIGGLDRLLTDGTGANAAEDLSEWRKHPGIER